MTTGPHEKPVIIELAVCLIIFFIVWLLLMQAYSEAIEKPSEVGCKSNLRQISVALLSYIADYDEVLPPASNRSRFHAATKWHYEEGEYWDVALANMGVEPKLWYCPAINQDEPIINPKKKPDFHILIFKENHGSYVVNYRTPDKTTDPYFSNISIAGVSLDRFDSSTRLPLIWDIRDWRIPNSYRVTPPHDSGIEVLYADGHVKRFDCMDLPIYGDYYHDESWKGLLPE